METSTMKRKLLFLFATAIFAVSLFSVWSVSAQNAYPPIPSAWTGSNTNLSRYFHYYGYPAYDPHPRYLGTLSGSWREIGEQYGERAGDLIRLVFEGWFQQVVPIQGSTEELLEYVRHQEHYYKALAPEALELMDGIARGAKEELNKSPYAEVMTHFEKILMINSYFGLQASPPTCPATPQAANPSRGGGGAGDVEEGCSGAVIFGKGTADGKVIHCSSEDQHFFPQEYLVTYVVHPKDRRAYTYTVTASAGEIGSEQALNDKGVVVSGYAGGGANIGNPTCASPFSGYRRPGLDWQLGCWYATAFSDTAKKAVELLTVGRPEYRKHGYKIVIGKCSKGANWVVSDMNEAYVVESIPADLNGVARYAVRHPGDMGEIGNYIVSTNNVEAKDSYNEQNVYDPTHPMSQHGSAFLNPVYGLGVNGSNGTRFMTFMWLIRDNYGHITPDMVKNWRTTHYVYDVGGTRHDTLNVPLCTVPSGDGYGQVSPHLVPVGTLCRHTVACPGVDTFEGINIYVSLSVAQDLTVYRTKGRPCEWTGPWDALNLNNIP